MANNVNTISFATPTDYNAEAKSIERRRQYAQLLQQQALQPTDAGEMVGNIYVRKSPLHALAKALQGYGGQKGMETADTQDKALAGKYQSDMVNALKESSRLRLGTPEQFVQPDPQEFQQAADQGTESPAGFTKPAVPGDAIAAADALLLHPGTQALGMQERSKAIDSAELQGIIKALRGGQPGTPQSGGGGQSYGQALTGAQSQEDPFANIAPGALALASSSNPHALKLGEMLQTAHNEFNKPQNVRPEGTVYLPGKGPIFTAPKGGVQTTWNNGQPSMGLMPGAAETTTALHNVPRPDAPMVKIALSGGQTAELTQPEYLQYTNTGQLPAKYGQQPPPQGQQAPGMASVLAGRPPAEQAAIQQVASAQGPMRVNVPPQSSAIKPIPTSSVVNGGLGTPGLTQSQPDQIAQKGQEAAATAAGRTGVDSIEKTYETLKTSPDQIMVINDVRKSMAGAKPFQGPTGEYKLYAAKVLRNVFGVNVDEKGVSDAEFMRSGLFRAVMDNLRKMDAQPTQRQQDALQQAMGSMATDPSALPRVLDLTEDIIRSRVKIHNERVDGASNNGVPFPTSFKVDLPERFVSKPGKDYSKLTNDQIKKMLGLP